MRAARILFFCLIPTLLLLGCKTTTVNLIPADKDAPPVIKIVPYITGDSDYTSGGITHSGTVKATVGTTIDIFSGIAENDLGGVKDFTIKATKYPVTKPVTATAQATPNSNNQVPATLQIFPGSNGNPAMSYKLSSCTDSVIVDADATNFNGMHNQMTVTFKANCMRISGISYFDRDNPKKYDKDSHSAQNGYLLVKHNPGCGLIGNDGHDKFFVSKSLPLGSEIINENFYQFWPMDRGCRDEGIAAIDDGGSYGAKEISNHDIFWHNACTGQYSDKDLFYLKSFVVSVPPRVDIGEPAFDIMTPMPQAPAGFGLTEASYNVKKCSSQAQSQPQSCANPQYFYFKVSCPSAVTSCFTYAIGACDLQTAQTATQTQNENCTIEQIDYSQYVNGCN